MSTDRRPVGAMIAALAVASGVVAGCTIPTDADRAEADVVGKTVTEVVVVPAAPTSLAGAAPSQPPAAAVGGHPLAGLDEFLAGLPGTAGVALAPVGGGQALTAGTWHTGVAWSTIKVPLAIAALQEPAGNAQQSNANRAITASDNAAAEALWASLGAPSAAAAKVQGVLATLGDTSTVVESRVLRPGFTAFGQTDWSLDDQTQFAARLACNPGAGVVLDLMGQINADQSWGLGTLPGAQFKGGWGPGADGGYLVRQFGVVDTAAGRLAVAIAAEPDSGAFGDGTAMLTQIAQWLGTHSSQLPARTGC